MTIEFIPAEWVERAIRALPERLILYSRPVEIERRTVVRRKDDIALLLRSLMR